ncbi:MAG: hypothetical protein QOJ79_2539 [Actinomycetota bacterium]|jgi:hypothetical protein|nr:hypothetical protein [Actinomycetota bacterium]
MSRRGVAALGVVVALGTAAVPAHAGPYAGQHRYVDTVKVSVHGADGATWQVQVAARVAGVLQSEADTPLLITLDRCVGQMCVPVGRWRQPVAPGLAAVADDLSSGSIDTTAMGLPIKVSLTATTQLPISNSVQLGYQLDDPTHISPRADYGKSAAGTLIIGKHTCKVTAGVLGEAVVRADSNGPNSDNRTAPPATWPAGMFGKNSSC